MRKNKKEKEPLASAEDFEEALEALWECYNLYFDLFWFLSRKITEKSTGVTSASINCRDRKGLTNADLRK